VETYSKESKQVKYKGNQQERGDLLGSDETIILRMYAKKSIRLNEPMEK